MELSTTRETTSCAATQEIPSILWNAKVHYLFHKNNPVFGSYPEPDEITPYHPILSLWDPS
jgi:hypothetical protein